MAKFHTLLRSAGCGRQLEGTLCYFGWAGNTWLLANNLAELELTVSSVIRMAKKLVGLELIFPNCTWIQVQRREQPEADAPADADKLRTMTGVPATGTERVPRAAVQTWKPLCILGAPQSSEPRGPCTKAKRHCGRSQAAFNNMSESCTTGCSRYGLGERHQALVRSRALQSTNDSGSYDAPPGQEELVRRRKMGMLLRPDDTLGKGVVGGNTRLQHSGGDGHATLPAFSSGSHPGEVRRDRVPTCFASTDTDAGRPRGMVPR